MNATALRISDFTDERIAEVRAGSPLTAEERDFLLSDLPSFEECSMPRSELAALTDADLMREAYSVWADYASGQV